MEKAPRTSAGIAVSLRWIARSRHRQALVWAILGVTAYGILISLPSDDGAINAPRFLRLHRDVPRGEPLQLADLELSTTAVPGALTEAYLEKVEGLFTQRDLTKGQSLLYSDLDWRRLLRGRIPAGALAYPISVEGGARLHEGDYVDLFVVPFRSGPAERVLEGVLVLDAGIAAEPLLALRKEEITWLEMARQKGKLRLAVRSGQDGLTRHSRRSLGSRRTRPVRSNNRKIPVEIWEEG